MEFLFYCLLHVQVFAWISYAAILTVMRQGQLVLEFKSNTQTQETYCATEIYVFQSVCVGGGGGGMEGQDF